VSRRTSIIVGPEGTIPPDADARKRLAEIRAKAKGHEFDGRKCCPWAHGVLPGERVPLLPSAYNSNLLIVQGARIRAIETERDP